MIYISHPYTGDEKNNRADSEQIAASLSAKIPGTVFINPLSVFRHLKKTNMPYDVVLAQCISLMGKCDGVIMADNWKYSEGCRREYARAKALGIVVWESKKEFMHDEIMPNDCCGKYACCTTCICQKCAERLFCWNCNDCTLPKGKRYAEGFTKGGCFRFREAE